MCLSKVEHTYCAAIRVQKGENTTQSDISTEEESENLQWKLANPHRRVSFSQVSVWSLRQREVEKSQSFLLNASWNLINRDMTHVIALVLTEPTQSQDSEFTILFGKGLGHSDFFCPRATTEEELSCQIQN